MSVIAPLQHGAQTRTTSMQTPKLYGFLHKHYIEVFFSKIMRLRMLKEMSRFHIYMGADGSEVVVTNINKSKKETDFSGKLIGEVTKKIRGANEQEIMAALMRSFSIEVAAQKKRNATEFRSMDMNRAIAENSGPAPSMHLQKSIEQLYQGPPREHLKYSAPEEEKPESERPKG